MPNRLSEDEKRRRKLAQLEKKVESGNSNQVKPGNILKNLHVWFDEEWLNLPMKSAECLSRLQSNDIQCSMEKLPFKNCVCWTENRSTYSIDQRNVEPSINIETEKKQLPIILHVMTGDELWELLNGNNFQSYVTHLSSTFASAENFLILVGCWLSLMKKLKKNKNNLFSVKQFEKEFIRTQFSFNNKCIFRFCESSEQISQIIYCVTKSISQLPTKKINLSDMVSLDGQVIDPSSINQSNSTSSNLGSLNATSSSSQIKHIWKLMLTQISSVSMEIAEAITEEYSTPRKLFDAYSHSDECTSSELLTNVEIRRSNGVIQSRRIVGKELSKRIYKSLTTTNPLDIVY
ncbi:hypothetical protein SNEBB_009129 [Seison nebaliae]|nr:hypothetical protein SNEBB_009129 [Seison nebaliae]